MAKRIFDLGELSDWAGDEDIAMMITSSLNAHGRMKPSNLFRGVACDDSKYATIKKTGTDHTKEDQDTYAQMQDHEFSDGTSLASSREGTDPQNIWAAPEDDLEMAVRYARREITSLEDRGVVLVYDGAQLSSVDGRYLHTFNGKPKDAVVALFRFT